MLVECGRMKSFLPVVFVATAALASDPLPEPKFRAVTLDDKIQIGYGVAVADVDGDEALDVLLADKKQFVWYRNPGKYKAENPEAWTKHLLAENLTEKDNVCLAARDLDGDGKCEIAVGAEWNPADTDKSGAVFYLIPPADRTQPWEAVKFPNVEPTTHRMKWVEIEKNVWGLVVVPLHGRGNKNGEGSPVKVLCYRKPADPKGEWPVEVVNESMHMTHNFDTFSDEHRIRVQKEEIPTRVWVTLAGREGYTTVGRFDGKWESLPVVAPKPETEPAVGAAGFRGFGEIRMSSIVGRIHAVGIEPMHGNQVVFYQSPYWEKKTRTRHVLTDQLVDGHALACGDLLGIGGDQVVVGWRGNPQNPRPVGIKLFTPLDIRGENWTERLIDDNEMACEDLVLADINRDGKLDVVASGRSTHNLKIYLNETPTVKYSWPK